MIISRKEPVWSRHREQNEMESGTYLRKQFEKCRRRMNFAKILDQGIGYAAAGGLFGALCEVISLFRPFYYSHLAAGLLFMAGFLAGAVHAFLHRADLIQAARRLDSYGFQERMVTACQLLGQENEFARMQRQDAFLYYERQKDRIRIPLWPCKRHIQAFLLAAVLVMGLGFIPSPAREEAGIRHQVKKEARDEVDKLKELIEALQGVDPESLTKEQQQRLSELSEALQLSREELAKAASWESLASAQEKLNYKYGQTARGLENLAGQLGDPGAAGIADAQALAKAIANEKGIQTASSKTSGNQNGGSDGGSGDGGENGDGSRDSGDGGNQNGNNGENGEGNGQGNGQDGNSGEGNGQGGSNGQGDGQGSGQGGSDGQGNGDGGNSGQGGGGGTGMGRGTGSSNRLHDYVSIPNDSGTDPSLTGQKNGDSDSDYIRQQNGLAWEGEHVDHNSVIGEYTDNAYEGLTSGRYPSGMESVIRDYFESLNK